MFEQPFAAPPEPGSPEAGNISHAEILRQREEAARVAEGKNKERDRQRRQREQQIGKELQGQLDAVNKLTEGYRRAAQSNMDRYTTEVDLLGKTEYEIELERGRGEIEKRYGDQAAALEDKKKGAKGATLALIKQSLSDLDALRTSELDIFEITRRQTLEYKLQQEEIKRVGDEIEKQIARQQSLGDAIREANKKAFEVRDAVPASQLVGLSSLEKQTLDIQESARKAGMAASEAYAANFGDIVTIQDGEEFAKGLDGIEAAYRRVSKAQIEVLNANYAITRSFDTGIKDAFTKFKEDAMDAGKQAKDSFSTFTSGMEDAFVKFVQTGKLSFSDLANSIIADLARIAVRKAIVGMAAMFGLAAGGSAMAGTPYMVGERGPELFIPQTAGKVIPNNVLNGSAAGQGAVNGGGQTMVTYNIQAVDASSFRSLVARDPSFIYAVTEAGRRSQPTRSR
jgi:phage-related minor tail protein